MTAGVLITGRYVTSGGDFHGGSLSHTGSLRQVCDFNCVVLETGLRMGGCWFTRGLRIQLWGLFGHSANDWTATKL